MNIHKGSNEVQNFMAKNELIEFIENFFEGKALGLQADFFMPPKTIEASIHIKIIHT